MFFQFYLIIDLAINITNSIIFTYNNVDDNLNSIDVNTNNF